MSDSRPVVWLLALALIAAVYVADQRGASERAALVERGELLRQLAIAEGDAATARLVATAYGDTAVILRARADSVARVASVRVTEARRTAEEAEGRVRATLDSLGASTAALDSLVTAHAEEVDAIRDELGAVTAERDGLRTYAEQMAVALSAAEAETAAARAVATNTERLWMAAERRGSVWRIVAAGAVVVAGWELVRG